MPISKDKIVKKDGPWDFWELTSKDNLEPSALERVL